MEDLYTIFVCAFIVYFFRSCYRWLDSQKSPFKLNKDWFES